MIQQAVRITWCTLVGQNNCFSVETKDKKSYRIVNFYHETMKYLLEPEVCKKGDKGRPPLLKWPIQIRTLCPGVAVIDDQRIADEHYRTDFCESCCPHIFLPLPQQLRRTRAIRRGDITIKKVTIGGRLLILESRKIVPVQRKLKRRWTVEAPKDLRCLHSKKAESISREVGKAGYILAPYIPCEVKGRVR